MKRAFSALGLALLTRLEELRLIAYLDERGRPTIGFGHTDNVTLSDVQRQRTITQGEAVSFLNSDVAWAVDAVNKRIRSELTQTQFDALVLFAFNVGAPQFWASTMAKRVEAGDAAAATREFSRWIFSDGHVSNGLIKRRIAERLLFEKGVYAAKPYG